MVKYIIKKGDKAMKVFGIDPGIATVGFGVVTIRTINSGFSNTGL